MTIVILEQLEEIKQRIEQQKSVQDIIKTYNDVLRSRVRARPMPRWGGKIAKGGVTGRDMPEAWPTKRKDSKLVIKCLVNHYIPHHGFPTKVRSDNWTLLKNRDLLEVEAMLGLKHYFGTVYYPQSQGKVKRMNQSVKTTLGKICAQTKLNWVDTL